ncbi:SUF system Fe-S cluster assembly regulator [Myxococcaceae bacterium GXIMD 01537]
MLRMSKMTDYGIVLLAELAREPGQTCTARELAERTRVPMPSTSKLLKAFLQAGLVVSQRGAAGGYGLARPASAISLTDIIAVLEGPVSITECGQHASAGAHCELEPVCRVRGHWRLINQTLQEALGRLSLADLCGPTPEPRPLVGLKLPAGPARAGEASS